MRPARSVGAVILVLILSAAVPAGRAQEGEVYIPDCGGEGPYVFVPPGPLDEVAGALLLLNPLFPLVMAWIAVPSRQFRFARGAAAAGLVLAAAQGVWAGCLLLDRTTDWGVPSWHPSMAEIQGFFFRCFQFDPPEWSLFLSAGAVWAAAAWVSIRVIDARRAAPPPAVAGGRVRGRVSAAASLSAGEREQ